MTPFDKFRAEGIKVDAAEAWYRHKDGGDVPCEICIKACRLRFAGGTNKEIHQRCCETGKVLYQAFLEETNERHPS